MSAHKNIDKICCIIIALAVLFTGVISNMMKSVAIDTDQTLPYESLLFEKDTVHTINISVDDTDWDDMLTNAAQKEYHTCDIEIDGKSFNNVGIRTKGNSSLTQVVSSDSDRYSFKIEFDHYDKSQNYYGLDKLCLNNIVQDNTYLKDYISYEILREAGVSTPLCSFVWIQVNGKAWGLYLAVEGIEEAFAERNYGSDYGKIYKPDSMNLNMGMGNDKEMLQIPENMMESGEMPDFEAMMESKEMPDFGNMPENGEMPDLENMPKNEEVLDKEDGSTTEKIMQRRNRSGGGPGEFGMNSASDVKLLYTDDEYDSYTNIFDNATFDITDSDKDTLIKSLKKLNDQENIEAVVDVEEVIQYFVGHNFVLNEDSYTGQMIHNYYLRESDGVLSMIPWDYNLAFGGMGGMGKNGTDATSLINSPIDTPTTSDMESLPMISWIFNDETYTQMYHDTFDTLISTYFESGKFTKDFEAVINMIAPYVKLDPTKFCTYNEFLIASNELKEFCMLRAESIRGQLNGTIPSTTETQALDSSNFVDGSSVNVESMGAQDFKLVKIPD